MNNEQMEKAKQVLLAKKKKLIDEKKRNDQADPFTDTERVNDNDMDADVDEQTGHEITEAVGEELEESITRLDVALVKMDSGTWGTCDVCSKPIEPKRLEIDPSVIDCSSCRAKAEA